MEDQQLVQNFLREFCEKIAEKFSDDLDFILLFGSAARGEWKKGISDVDLIIQMKKTETVENAKEFSNKIFWELNAKHGTKFEESCSIGGKKDKIKKIIEKTKLYVPFEIFGPEDIDWVNGKIKRKDLILGAKLVASQAMLFQKMKCEGKILYGRDIRKIIQIKPSWWEKSKALLIPYHISFCSVFGALLFPKIALKMSDKAAIYSVESVLFFLNKPIGKGINKATEEVEKEIKQGIGYKHNFWGMMEMDLILNFGYQKLFHPVKSSEAGAKQFNGVNFNFAKEAIQLKYNWTEQSKKFNRWEILKFCLRSFLFVNAMNWYAILRADKHRIILKIFFLLRTILLFLIVWLCFCQ
jgi:predicted nucleotidyltransferase